MIRRNGFTLVELLVVIAIIALLLSIISTARGQLPPTPQQFWDIKQKGDVRAIQI